MRRALVMAVVIMAIAAPVLASVPTDEFGYFLFKATAPLKPLVAGVPQCFSIPVASVPAVDAYGNPIIDPATGLQDVVYTWSNWMDAAKRCVWTKDWFVQSVQLEKIHIFRKGACGLIWGSDYLLQKGKLKGQINLFWPLLYETHGTCFVLSIVYQTPRLCADPDGRSRRVHKERYIWCVEWDTFADFLARFAFLKCMPAGQCELPVVPPATAQMIQNLLTGYGAAAFGNYVPGILTILALNPPTPADISLATSLVAQLEALIDEQSCTDPCSFGAGKPGATGILNTDTVPGGSLLLTDLYYAANKAGLLID